MILDSKGDIRRMALYYKSDDVKYCLSAPNKVIKAIVMFYTPANIMLFFVRNIAARFLWMAWILG